MYSLPQKNLVKCQNPCHNLMHEIEIQVILVYTTISFIHTEIYTVKYRTTVYVSDWMNDVFSHLCTSHFTV